MLLTAKVIYIVSVIDKCVWSTDGIRIYWYGKTEKNLSQFSFYELQIPQTGLGSKASLRAESSATNGQKHATAPANSSPSSRL
jgi:hypothetical protein